MGANCAPLVAHLFLFRYKRDFTRSLYDDKQVDIIDARLTLLLDIKVIVLTFNKAYFDNTVCLIYPSELQLNKANTSDTEAAVLDLHLSVHF